MDHTTERRSHRRLNFKRVVELTAGERQAKRLAMAKDLSLGGMCIEVTKPPVPGGRVVVGLVDGARATVLLTGTVKWATPTGMGIQFEGLGARESLVILKLCRFAA